MIAFPKAGAGESTPDGRDSSDVLLPPAFEGDTMKIVSPRP